ncbi:hypothetical protein [Coleofasciculus sp. G2-EDA-02]|uniref:hypothetical protein n=1 Tax=Coleofasciculus sp. G2-EDA-02 TaxID=3069529 RepID=UPI003302AAAB
MQFVRLGKASSTKGDRVKCTVAYCCDRPGATCDFRSINLPSDRLEGWITSAR